MYHIYKHKVTLPDTPVGTHINMMPFIPEQAEQHLEGDLEEYIPLVAELGLSAMNLTCYLTVDVSLVEKGKTQRRAGAHTEAGVMPLTGMYQANGGAYREWAQYGWGGYWGGELRQRSGVWMVSNMSGTTRVWNTEVDREDLGVFGEVAEDSLKGIKHKDLDAGIIVHMSDRTPHAALPAPEDGIRHYVRVVGPYVSVWFEDDNTTNPACPVPDEVMLINGSKHDYVYGSGCPVY